MKKAAFLLAALGLVSLGRPGPAGEPAATPAPAPAFAPGREARLELPGAGTFALVWVPRDYDPGRPWPVIFSYHGFNGRANTGPFKRVTGGEGFVIVGMNYATPEYAKTLDRARLARERACFEEALELTAAALNVDRSRLLMGGFSQGGYSTSVLGEHLAARLAGLVLLGSGRSWQEGAYPPPAGALKGKAVFIGVGADDGHNRDAGRACVPYYRQWGADVTFEEWPATGHRMNYEASRLAGWLADRFGKTGEEAPAPSPTPASSPAPAATPPAAPTPPAREPTPSPEEEAARRLSSWWAMAENYRRVGRTEQAARYLERILAADPEGDWGERARQALTALGAGP